VGDSRAGAALVSATGVAVITGGARGIGAATAVRLVATGWQVGLLDLALDADDAHTADLPGPYRPSTAAQLDTVVAECGGHAVGLRVDVRDPSAVAAAVDAVADRFGRLDAAVACAGMVAGGVPIWESDRATWRAVLDVNLDGVAHLAVAAIPHLLAHPEPRSGRFVAVASAAGHHGLPGLAAYAAAKHGVIGLVRSLAAELGASGVTANAVAPGSSATAMLDASAALYGLPDVAPFAAGSRIGRLIDPDEIASTIAWLCTDAPGALTGAVLDVDGGFRP
jgi:SDR family mycofactocin-dependent oxidoreductase